MKLRKELFRDIKETLEFRLQNMLLDMVQYVGKNKDAFIVWFISILIFVIYTVCIVTRFPDSFVAALLWCISIPIYIITVLYLYVAIEERGGLFED